MKQTERDPRAFLAAWRVTPWYAAVTAAYFNGKNFAVDVTEAEKQAVFEASDAAKLALISFARDDVALCYEPEQYPLTARNTIEAYIEHVRLIFARMQEYPERNAIVDMDRQRSALHSAVARELTSADITPNLKLGRAVGRLILIDCGLDTYSSALDNDIHNALL